MLSYLIWKRTFRATCWFENQDPCPTDRYFMIIFWRPPGVLEWSSTFWPLTLQPLEIYWATVQQMKGYIHGFHMRYNNIPCPKRLQRYWFWNFLSESSLVILHRIIHLIMLLILQNIWIWWNQCFLFSRPYLRMPRSQAWRRGSGRTLTSTQAFFQMWTGYEACCPHILDVSLVEYPLLIDNHSTYV